jgi:hypothetical protein
MASHLRKPMASARRVSLFDREIRLKLSTAALEIFFDVARVLSEGQVLGQGYSGSTMITIDLARVEALVRDGDDPAVVKRVAELCAKDPRVRAQARALAAAEAEERAGRRLARLHIDEEVRASGTSVQIDLDVEGELHTAAHSA